MAPDSPSRTVDSPISSEAVIAQQPSQRPDGDATNARPAVSGTVFLSVNIALILAVAVIGSSPKVSSQGPPRPVPDNVPVIIVPQYNDPNVVSDIQLQRVLHKLRPALRGRTPNINHVDHALRLWGVKATFEDPDCFSGVELRGLLTDHRHFQEHWGSATQPFIQSNTHTARPYVEFRTRSGSASSSHVDHTLASLAEVATPLDYPLNTPSGELPLKAAFDLAFDRFQLNQGECEWSVLAFLHYLPHVKSWETSEGQLVTWDMISARLMRRKFAQGSCYGNHRLHTLACLLRIDEDKQVLSSQSRKDIVAHLRDATARLVESQRADGFWTREWPGNEWDGNSNATSFLTDETSERILATGHALEWWALAPENVLPPRDCVVSAAQWLVATIDEMSDSEISRSYTFLTHAGRALALWRGAFPADLYTPGAIYPLPDNPGENGHDTSSGESP